VFQKGEQARGVEVAKRLVVGPKQEGACFRFRAVVVPFWCGLTCFGRRCRRRRRLGCRQQPRSIRNGAVGFVFVLENLVDTSLPRSLRVWRQLGLWSAELYVVGVRVEGASWVMAQTHSWSTDQRIEGVMRGLQEDKKERKCSCACGYVCACVCVVVCVVLCVVCFARGKL
jgi:hypothetical protein